MLTANGATEYWGNSYGYDAWGNLLSKSVTKCSAESLNVTALANNQLSGYGYDAAGNMTHDATTGNNYTFDPENRITGAVGYSYTYDADGNRVEKSNGSTGTIYWYMTPGIVAESNLSGNLKSEYVFFNGRRVARKDLPGGAVSYYFSDDLKTASVITNAAGTIIEDEDFYPWGGEVPFVTSDSNHYKFTSKERDAETGLDYFGARYYGNWLGRWMSPDWSATPEPVPYSDLEDPQSLNLYGYVRSVPTSKIDLNGHDDKKCGFGCHFKNWWTGGGWNDDQKAKDVRQQRQQEMADEARRNLSQLKNLKLNGQDPADFAKNLNNQQAIAAWNLTSNAIIQLALSHLFCPSGASCGIAFPVDFADADTVNWSATFKTEGEARAFARTKLGEDPVEVGPNKLRSQDGKWQYRAKPVQDVSQNHIHLEMLDPDTGRVIQNLSFHGATFSSQSGWSNFRQFFEDKDSFVLCQNQQVINIIPKRELAPEQTTVLRGYFERNIGRTI